ncbi:hypothetical protein HMPREF1544_05471 [Mucor circinelloides 1006PhL]|uniref:DUF7801 domain-containing protein n=1 Tax=Mucor circinelloides f. circinelloides (strain 1006PhL) TaxID=1220926 RepID=S2K646_MUCC1|nr:hypothetical protein HMPREF1544_05471 [Mucor circinelloides 1006PhL]
MIQTTTSTDKKREAVKSSQSANNDDKMPVMRDVGTWTPSRKQQSSLTHLKSKFAAKSSVMDIGIATNHASMEEDVLPWQQFGVPTEQQQLSTAPKDYNAMLQELNVTHAVMVASKFKPVDFVQVEQLVQASCFELTIVRFQIRVQTDTQRAVATAFKLDPSSITDLMQDICQSSQQTAMLVDEFYFTSQSAHRTETKYLEHLAGTLAAAMQQQYSSPQEDIHRVLAKILVKLESTANYFDDSVERQQVPTLGFTSSSSSSSSSASSVSSSSAFTLANSIDTSPSTVYMTNEGTPTSTLHQKIDDIIEKLSRQLKQKQELLRVMEIQSNTHEELARQRARSASLVLELERSRSKRQLIAKKQEKDMIVLRDQLMQETMRRQSLQDRVTSLEHALKSKEAEISKLKTQPSLAKEDENHTSCQLQIKQLCLELQRKKEAVVEEKENKEKENLSLQRKLDVIEQRNMQLQQTIKEQHEREMTWTCQKKSILEQCQHAIHTEFIDCEAAVASTIAHLTERQQQQAGRSMASVPEESHLQQQLARLQQEFDQAKQTFTTRESAFILQSASTEAELERILKEYDRLTRNIVDFNNERKKFEDEIQVLHQDKQLLEKRICDDKVSTIKESSLRKEFRSLMASVKDKHTKAILQELEKQRQLEQELRDIKSDIEMKRWEKVDVAVQTHYFDIK